MNRTPWVDRKFTLDLPAGWLFNVIERLHGTKARMEDLCGSLSEDQLQLKPDAKWSIKEHVGHLYDLEFLHIKRIMELKHRKDKLTGADMSNKRTYSSNHNEVPIKELIGEFSEQRLIFISEFSDMKAEDHNYSAVHPRLLIPMRPIDLAYFSAEHDDHHLCSMREITSLF
ncbi:MAG: DinB family protein [Saprospiraceae bacterium]|nr:DinB family protein [Bacteroidia bacterium]NNK90213.1 DinB family protein [Saprospiraceae bacterium]